MPMHVDHTRIFGSDRSPGLPSRALTAGCKKVCGKKASGTRADRPEPQRTLADVQRDGDSKS